MSASKRRASSPEDVSRAKIAHRLMDDSILARQLQQDFDNEGEAKKRARTQRRNNKRYAGKL